MAIIINISHPEFITMDGDKTISATFMPVAVYVVTAEAEGSGTIALLPNVGSYCVGTEIFLSATPEPGFQFDQWSGDINDDQSPIHL